VVKKTSSGAAQKLIDPAPQAGAKQLPKKL
jgi:hypothetical protein